jgi:hypothetical protein
VNDRDYPQALFPSGTQRARPASCTLAQASFLIIPEPERPRRGPHTCDAYRVKVPSYRSCWANCLYQLRAAIGGVGVSRC